MTDFSIGYLDLENGELEVDGNCYEEEEKAEWDENEEVQVVLHVHEIVDQQTVNRVKKSSPKYSRIEKDERKSAALLSQARNMHSEEDQACKNGE